MIIECARVGFRFHLRYELLTRILSGLGDTHHSFTTLARQLSLPSTLCLSVLAPTPLPFDLGPGNHWGDDILFDPSPSAPPIETDTGFSRARRMVTQHVIRDTLMGKCAAQPREIMLFGFGQGGSAALAAAVALIEQTEEAAGKASQTLGGIISIGGPLPTDAKLSQAMAEAGRKCQTPVLICAGATGSAVTKTNEVRLRAVFESVEVVRWQRRGDGMMRNREEMLPIMRFFARHLRSRAGVPSGAVEVG